MIFCNGKSFNKPIQDYIQGRNLNSTLGWKCFKNFYVVFIVSIFVDKTFEILLDQMDQV